MSLPRSSVDYLNNMAAEIELVSQFIDGYSFEMFEADRKTWYAVVRELLVIGEAAKRVPESVRDRAPTVPWRLITGMRDRLVHDYDRVILNVVWSTVRDDLPLLLPAIHKLRDELVTEEPPRTEES